MISARNAEEWRAWLDEHHETESEVWLRIWKKSSGKQSIDWAQAVEVALRYGWIDGLLQSIDDEQYRQRFTPRRPKSKWSKVNKEIALRLIEAGEMTAMGLRAVEAAKASGEWDRAYSALRPLRAPEDLREAIKEPRREAEPRPSLDDALEPLGGVARRHRGANADADAQPDRAGARDPRLRRDRQGMSSEAGACRTFVTVS